jgi:glutamine amidotransferase
MNKAEVVVIDYGVGNLLSVQRAFERCGVNVLLSADPEVILNADRVVLPGVGAFTSAMKALDELGLVSVICELDKSKVPLLGICLGMQLLLDQSEEFGEVAGLGLIPGRVIAVPHRTISGNVQKIPHIGWNALQPSNLGFGWENTLLHDTRSGEEVYFIHSFMAVPENASHRVADCLYGEHKISAVIARDHISGCQFHPEKSGESGLKIIKRFCVD